MTKISGCPRETRKTQSLRDNRMRVFRPRDTHSKWRDNVHCPTVDKAFQRIGEGWYGHTDFVRRRPVLVRCSTRRGLAKKCTYFSTSQTMVGRATRSVCQFPIHKGMKEGCRTDDTCHDTCHCTMNSWYARHVPWIFLFPVPSFLSLSLGKKKLFFTFREEHKKQPLSKKTPDTVSTSGEGHLAGASLSKGL